MGYLHVELVNWIHLKGCVGYVVSIERLEDRCLQKETTKEGLSVLMLQRRVLYIVLTFFFCGGPEVFTRLRLFITSVLRLMGRGVPCNLRKSPHALHNTEPLSSRRQRGVVEVVQFWQTG